MFWIIRAKINGFLARLKYFVNDRKKVNKKVNKKMQKK